MQIPRRWTYALSLKKKNDYLLSLAIWSLYFYNLSGESEGKAVAGVAIGTASAAGVATTVAGAALAPAIPLILAGGSLWSANIAREAKDKIFNECMKDRGYEVYIAN